MTHINRTNIADHAHKLVPESTRRTVDAGFDWYTPIFRPNVTAMSVCIFVDLLHRTILI